MTSLALRPKGPQPILDSLTEPDVADLSDTPSEHRARPRTAPRIDAPPNGFAHINRSSTQVISYEQESRRASRNASPAGLAPRPGMLLRAKSDFGPRREELNKGDDDSKTSADAEWGIRHGFETQLESEEYNNLLNSVYTTSRR
jgi:regulator-associated protein of mTOR